MKNIAIIIDCWGKYQIPYNYPLHHNIINLISANQSIDTVILASYQISPDEFNTNNLWYINFKNFNYSKAFTNPIVQNEMYGSLQHSDLHTIDYQTERRTCNCMLHKVWPDKFQIAAFHPYQLKLVGIENVYFFGEAWDICIRKRAMGYTWWIENTNTNLFVYRDGVRFDMYDIDTDHWNLVPGKNELYKFDRNFTKFY